MPAGVAEPIKGVMWRRQHNRYALDQEWGIAERQLDVLRFTPPFSGNTFLVGETATHAPALLTTYSDLIVDVVPRQQLSGQNR